MNLHNMDKSQNRRQPQAAAGHRVRASKYIGAVGFPCSDAENEYNGARKVMLDAKAQRVFSRGNGLEAKRRGRTHHMLQPVVELQYTTRTVVISG